MKTPRLTGPAGSVDAITGRPDLATERCPHAWLARRDGTREASFTPVDGSRMRSVRLMPSHPPTAWLPTTIPSRTTSGAASRPGSSRRWRT